MPTLTEFFIDSVEFKFATCVFTDLSLTTVAPAGYYSDGAFVRYQTVTAGVGSLGPAINSVDAEIPNDECPSCVNECQISQSVSGNNIYAININKGSATSGALTLPPMLGIYNITTGLGTGPTTAGAVIARVWISNQYGAGVGLLLESGTSLSIGGVAEYSSNNFSASGTLDFSSSLTLDQQFLVTPGEPRLGGDDGGYQKNINQNVLDNDTDFLFVGHAATSPAAPGANANGGVIFQSGTAPCTTPDVMQVPNNSPNFTLGLGAPSTTFTLQNRNFLFDSGSGQSAFAPNVTETITVNSNQVQFGPPSSFDNPGVSGSGFSFAPGGYKGWFTAVVPRPANTTGDSFGARIRIAMLGCDAITNGVTTNADMAAYGVKVNINCAEILEPISYLFENPFDPNGQSQTFYCSQPQDTEIAAFAVGENDLTNLIYNVPGAIGTYATQDTQSIVVNESGVPNRWDIVCSSPDGSGSINNSDIPKYVKYKNSQGEDRVFEVTNNVITRTNISFSPSPVACGTIIQNDSNKVGGGLYQVDYTTGAATGAVIVRIFAGATEVGANPVGLFVKKLNISGDTVLVRTNSFAVRGSQNITGDLTEDGYITNSMSLATPPNTTPVPQIDITQTGAIEGGSVFTLNTGGADELLPEQIFIQNSNGAFNETRAQRSIFYNDNNGSEIIAGGITNIYSQQLYIDQDGNSTLENAQVGSSFQATYDMFMYIGKLNQGNAPISYIPCTNLDNEVDCSMGFAPGGQGAQDSNFGGQINLPNSGSHQYNGNFGLLPNNPLELEYLNGEVIQQDVYLYPQAVTLCDEGALKTNIYDGQTNQFISGTSTYLHVISGPQVQLYEGEDKSPGWIMAVIPKPEADDRLIRVEGVSITSNTALTVKVECPAALPAISTTNVHKVTNTFTLATYCAGGVPAGAPSDTCFIAHNSYGGNSDDPTTTTGAPCIPGVAGTGACGGAAGLAVNIPYMNDMVFTDANGQTPLEDGTYFAPTGGDDLWFTVRHGIVRCVKDCNDQTPCNYA